jgi:hypothetical protein
MAILDWESVPRLRGTANPLSGTVAVLIARWGPPGDIPRLRKQGAIVGGIAGPGRYAALSGAGDAGGRAWLCEGGDG